MKSFIQYLQEAGFNRAVNSGDPALMQRELQKRKARLQYYRDEKIRLEDLPNFEGAGEAEGRRQQAEDLKKGILELDMPLSAMGIKTGTKLSELPSEMPWDDGPLPLDPNIFDGPDKGKIASAEEVKDRQQDNQLTGTLHKPYPTPAQMVLDFYKKDGRRKK